VAYFDGIRGTTDPASHPAGEMLQEAGKGVSAPNSVKCVRTKGQLIKNITSLSGFVSVPNEFLAVLTPIITRF
jgi:hypothetical protein